MRVSTLLRDDEWFSQSGSNYNSHSFVASVVGVERLFDGADSQQLVVDRVMFHEVCHWRQYTGTTLGIAILLGRWAQHGSLFHLLEQCSESERNHLLDQRRSGVPLIPLEPAGSLAFESDNPALSLAAGAWHVQLLAEAILVDPARVLKVKVPYPLPYLVSDYLVDLVQGCPPVFGDEAEILYPNDRPLIEIDGPPFPLTATGDLLSTRAIMEGSATANEYLLLRGSRNVSDEAGQAASTALRQLQGNGVYGDATREFCRMSGLDHSSVDEWICPFLLCCDLALNPPLPPFVRLPDVISQPIRWLDLYPPSRFLRAAAAASRLGSVDFEALFEREAELSHSIARLAGLTHWSDLQLAWDHEPTFFGPNSPALNGGKDPNGTFSGEDVFLSFLGHCVKSNWADRLDGTTSFALPAFSVLVEDPATRGAFHRVPPIITNHETRRFWNPTTLSNEDVLDLGQTILAIYLSRDVLAGEGPLDVRTFPSAIATEARSRRALNGLMLGDDFDLPFVFANSA